jgi:3-oxoacyl-[acyl-carrier protein] reductase
MKKLKKVADEIGAIPLSFDISDLKSIPQKAKEVTDFIRRKIDTLVNNVGIAFPVLGKLQKTIY